MKPFHYIKPGAVWSDCRRRGVARRSFKNTEKLTILKVFIEVSKPSPGWVCSSHSQQNHRSELKRAAESWAYLLGSISKMDPSRLDEVMRRPGSAVSVETWRKSGLWTNCWTSWTMPVSLYKASSATRGACSETDCSFWGRLKTGWKEQPPP